VRRYDEYIARAPGVQGGEPVIKGTRTPVRTIAVLYRDTYPDDLDKVHASLPHLTADQVKAALGYYNDHRAEVDGHILRHRTALQRFRAAS
jgi:uncharacterized protein (DUF433 family)